MNNYPIWPCVAAVTTCIAGAPALADTHDRAAEGRAIAAEFGARLRAELQAAMAEAGPLAAVRVCHEEAPRIAREAEESSGAVVARTSTKVRNPANRPDAHQLRVLAGFADAIAAGNLEPPPEQLDALEDGRVRFMSAIIMQSPCLVCHGAELAPPVAAATAALYPEDEARGYELGELRGAFTITWPAR